MKVAVYTLSDSSGVRYVGIAKDPHDRLSRHLREWRGKHTHRANWLRSLLASGQIPQLGILEWVDDWDEAERRWIKHFRASGCRLVNGNDGGIDMRQAREAGERFPNVKRMYRVLESLIRGKHITESGIDTARKTLDLYCQIVAKHRHQQTLPWLDARLERIHADH